MDFSLGPNEVAFRNQLSDWLDRNLPTGGFSGAAVEMESEQGFEEMRAWHKKLYAGGWIGIHWPKEFGGRGASLIERYVYERVMEERRVPRGVNTLGIMMAGPVIYHWGTEEQKQRHLKPILAADQIWCEGLSEPGSGSDLASLQTRAVDHGDYFVVSGQKVWTSGAHRSDFCQLFVRTDPEAPKHKGISCLIVDMKSPGVTVRPLVQITGAANFNEVFFEEVKVPRANLIGPKNQGWQVLVTTLMFERSGIGNSIPVNETLGGLIGLAKRVPRGSKPASEDPAVRQRLAQFAIECQALRCSLLRALTRQLKGQPPGPEGSAGKLFGSELQQRMSYYVTELLGQYATLDGDPLAPENGRWTRGILAARGLTIAGGTSEVQRNIVAERVLGLPKG